MNYKKYRLGWRGSLTKKQQLSHYWGLSLVIVPVLVAVINTVINY